MNKTSKGKDVDKMLINVGKPSSKGKVNKSPISFAIGKDKSTKPSQQEQKYCPICGVRHRPNCKYVKPQQGFYTCPVPGHGNFDDICLKCQPPQSNYSAKNIKKLTKIIDKNKKLVQSSWENEFEERFVCDDGTMNKYDSFQIKVFIKVLLAKERNKR